MATEKVKVLTLDTQPAQVSVKDLRNELKELRSTLLSTEKGTEEYNEALKKSAEITHTLKEQTEEINATAMDFGQIASNVSKSVGGMVAGFQAAKATLSLFGVENEEVLQSLKKMQDLMAITQALPAIDNGIKAFKRLGLVIKSATAGLNGMKAALVSTGIGAIAVAVGLLAANWDKVTDAVSRFVGKNPDLVRALDDINTKIKEGKDKLDDLSRSYDNWVTKDKVSKLNKNAREKYDELSNSIEGATLKLEELKQAEKVAEDEAIKAAAQRLKGSAWKAVNDAQAVATANRKEAEKTLESLKAQQQAILDNANSYKEVEKSATTAAEKAVNSLNVLMQTFINSLSPDTLQDELLAKFGSEPIVIPVKVEYGDEEEESDVSKEDAFREKIKSTVDSLKAAFGMSEQEQYQQELQALELWKNTELLKYKESEEEKLKILTEYNKLRDALNKEQTQREMMRYASAAASIGDIFSNLGELMEEGSEEQKAFQIMGATVNMLGGITAAVSGAFTTHSGPWDIALAVLQAAAIATSGAINIAKMSKTNEKNAKSMASSGAAATSAIQSITAPVQYTQDVQGASIEGAIKDSKVYVTETDISNTQNRVKVSETEATF